MLTPVFAILVLAGAALYFMKPDERRRLGSAVAVSLARAARVVRDGREPHDDLDALILARTPHVVVTPTIVAVWVCTCLAAGIGAGPDALIAWGANYAPRTTAGEWWRLVSYVFVPDGFFRMLVAIAAIVPLGIVLERLAGRMTFAATYVAAAAAGGAVTLWVAPATTITTGPAPGICGLFGLLLASFVYGYARAPRLPVSSLAAKRIAAGAAVFVVSAQMADIAGAASNFAGLAAGVIVGLASCGDIVQRKPRMLRSLAVPTALAALTLAAALPLRGTIDARPAIASIAEVETRTAADYAKAVDAYTHGRLNAKALAQLIERTILPALAADRTRVEALRGVPREQAGLVADARHYFQLREVSWRRRIDALRGSNMKLFREADGTERAALDVFDRLQRGAATGS
jgi:membrane associated rhomboid family serine protease